MSIEQIADRLIPLPENKIVLKNNVGETRDIIKEVLECFRDNREQLKAFAPHLKAHSVLQTCNNIWNFWKGQIRYQVDADGTQLIKTPAAVWASKFCDCKSFSVAVASTLNALGIRGKFRFTSYGSNSTLPTHVYVVAMYQGREIIIDCVWNRFNDQKPYTKKWDYNMTSIYRISGTDTSQYAVGELNIDVHDNTVTEAELEVALNKQRLEMEQAIARRKGGIGAIGSPLDDAYQTEIEAHSAALAAIGRPKGKRSGRGVVKKIKSAKQKKAAGTIKKRKGSIFKRIGKGLKKLASTPLRLAAKTQLPKNAPFFLYLFLSDKVLAKAPEAVTTKRQHALKFRNILVDKLQMKESNFNRIVRNGIMNHFGKTPEDVLAGWMKQANFKVGVIPALAKGLQLAAKGLKALLGKFGQNLAADVEQYTPAPEDWGAIPEEEKKEMVKEQKENVPPVVQPTGGGGYNYNHGEGNSGHSDEPGVSTGKGQGGESGGGDGYDGVNWDGDNFNDGKTLEPVTVTSKGKEPGEPGDGEKPAPKEAGGGGMVLLGLAAVGLLLAGGSGGKKGRK